MWKCISNAFSIVFAVVIVFRFQVWKVDVIEQNKGKQRLLTYTHLERAGAGAISGGCRFIGDLSSLVLVLPTSYTKEGSEVVPRSIFTFLSL
jgi:hypothetical protein